MFTKISITNLLAIFFLSLAACTITGKNIAVTTTDYKFTPSTWTVKAGQRVTLTMTNQGLEEHEWVLLKKGASVTLPFSSDDEDKVFWEAEARSGTIKTVTFIAPTSPGTYTIVCGHPKHLENGMKGSLIVQ